jgi:signal transduction histidine kinase/ActR/RegA family two-component response regulator
MKLRSHLVVLVLVALLPVVLFSTIVVAVLAQHERDATDRGLRSTARALALAVDHVVENSITTLGALAASEHLDTGNLAAFHRASLRVMPGQTGWLSIALFAPAGEQLLNVLQPFGTPLPTGTDRAYFQQVVRTRQPAVSGLLVGRVAARPHVVVVVPVFRKNALVYVLLASLRLDSIGEVLARQRLDRDWIGAIVDRDGVILARTRDGDRFVGERATPGYLALTSKNDEGSARTESKDGAVLHTAFSRAPVAGWTVAIAMPVGAMDAAITRFLITIGAGGLVFLLSGIAVAMLLGRRIAAPIMSLSSIAARFGRGESSPAGPAGGVDEVNVLQEALATAAEQRREIEEERTRLLAREQQARALAEAARERAHFLAEASTVLASSLEYETTLQAMARLAIPRLGDLCIVDLVDDDGAIRRVAAAHVDPAKMELVRDLQRRFPPDRDGPHPVARALRSGRVEVAGEISGDEMHAIAADPAHLKIARALDYRSYLVVPLMARGRTLGAISLVVTGSRRRYVTEDVPFVEDLARRAALAVDNARLFGQSETRQRVAEALAEAGRFLGQALDPDVVGQRMTDSVRTLLALRTAIFYRVDPQSGEMVVVAFSGEVPPGFALGFTLPAGAATVGAAVEARHSVFTPDVLTDRRLVMPAALRTRLEHAAYRSVLAVPLLVHDRVIGVLALGDVQGRRYSAEDMLLVQGFVDQAALALENARLYTEAQEANRAKDEFLATLSHELRTPLTAMLGWVRMLQSGRLDEATAGRALQVIDRNTKLQAQLIDDLLDVSRIITGKLHLDLRPVNLLAVIDSAVESVEQGADAKSITIERELDAAVSPVWGDAHRLQQVVWNLLSNAIKFTPAGGTVRVRLYREDPHVCIAVVDTGKGIDPDFLPLMFERFRQADSTSTRAHGGLGIGLAIVRHLVELHHGGVSAESAGLGRGATFTVRLPLVAVRVNEHDQPGRLASRSSVERFPELRGVRVLVVDDEADARDLVAAVLEQCGAEVTPAGSAGEALDALDRVRPHVLISDISMPDVDGYALISKVRALGLDRGGRVPAVALTAYARAEDRERALAVGFQMHVAKPVEPADLVDVVSRLAGRRTADA